MPVIDPDVAAEIADPRSARAEPAATHDDAPPPAPAATTASSQAGERASGEFRSPGRRCRDADAWQALAPAGELVSGDLAGIAAPHLGWLDASIEDTPHVAIVVDAEGTVLLATGFPTDIVQGLALRPGADRPAAPDASGAALALSTRQPVTVPGCGWLNAGWPRSTSSAAPILGLGGEVVGAVELASADGGARLATVAHIAYAIGQELAGAQRSAAAELSARRLARLQDVTAAFSRALDEMQVAAVGASVGVRALGADLGVLMRLRDDGAALELAASVGFQPTQLDRLRLVPLDAPVEAAEVARTGVPLFVESSVDEIGGADAADAERWSHGWSRGVLPLVLDGRTLGTLGFVYAREQRFDADQRAFALAVAAQCAQALDRARLFEQERRARHARERLLAFVSHDLRNPLAAMRAATALVEGSAPPGDAGAELRRRAAVLDRAAQRMDRLVGELLDLGALAAGRLALRMAAHDVTAIVEETAELFWPLADAHGLELRTRTPASACGAECDRDRLMQVLANLVGNAIKFTPRGGHIEIELTPGDDAIECAVEDDGPGIAPEVLPSIFDPYVTGRGKPGADTGLGLYIARGIVETHGGRLEVTSRLGQGSRFAFMVPRQRRSGGAP